MTVRRLLFSALLLAFCLGCGKPVPTVAVVPEAPSEPAKPLGPDAAQVFRNNSAFACDLYARLRTEQAGNLFFSPASLSTALAMAHAGARGATADEMAKALHFDLPSDRLHLAFGELLTNLRGGRGGSRLAVANRRWGQRGHGFLPEFLGVTRTHFGAELAEVDFRAQPEEARVAINRWTGEQTRGRIPALVPPNLLGGDTRLVLTNAIHFQGDWAEPFKEAHTTSAPFRGAAGRQVEVPFMRRTDSYRLAALPGFKLLELPYEGGEWSMLVLLPDADDGLGELEKQLTAPKLVEWRKKAEWSQVDVHLPKFRLETEARLVPQLRALGMTAAFESERADFSGMSKSPLFLSQVIHRAFVDVHEKGTEAAAATMLEAKKSEPARPVLFRADHPFVLAIVEAKSGGILFLGRLVEPKGS